MKAVGREFQSFEPLWKKELCPECVLQEVAEHSYGNVKSSRKDF